MTAAVLTEPEQLDRAVAAAVEDYIRALDVRHTAKAAGIANDMHNTAVADTWRAYETAVNERKQGLQRAQIATILDRATGGTR